MGVASLAPPIPDNLGVLGLPALSNLMISPQVSGAKQAIGDAGEALYRMKGGTKPCLQSGGPTIKATELHTATDKTRLT